MRLLPFILAAAGNLAASQPSAGEKPTREEAVQALRKAVTFFHSKVASHGGYVWSYSGDLRLREGEGRAPGATIWVQPPGTPFVGEAFLDAYEATGQPLHLKAARDAAGALILGQMHSGGWHYRIEFDRAKRARFSYRRDVKGGRRPDPTSPADRKSAGGWEVWKKRKYRGNLTILDDDTTQAAVRFLMRLDAALRFKDEKVHEAAQYALASLLNAQYPNGAWSANYDRFPDARPDPKRYPAKKASHPDTWSRKWTKAFAGCYVTNDNLMGDMIATMLRAWESYRDKRYLASAERAGGFLLLAQMPDPQPAWAQQYDRHMHPVWDRAFEPPAVTGAESQTVMEVLLVLHRRTGEKKYLDAVSRALAYFKKSRLPDGRLARFYELKTNRPLYFRRGADRRYRLTYSRDRLPKHYAFVVDSRLDAIEAKYRRLLAAKRPPGKEPTTHPAGRVSPPSAKRVRQIINAMDDRGAWVERGRLRFHKIEPASGVISPRAFVRNVRALSRFVARGR